MAKKRIIISTLLGFFLLFSMTVSIYATSFTIINPDSQGQSEIVGNDTLVFSEDTVWANLTARWGVRIIFQDDDKWNNEDIQNQLLPVTDNTNANTKAPADPEHDGWKFVGWKRIDTNNGTSTLNEDKTVTDINGPGPIIYQAMYEKNAPTISNGPIKHAIPDTSVKSENTQYINFPHNLFIGISAFIALSLKNKRVRNMFILIIVGAIIYASVGFNNVLEIDASSYTYGQYDMTYLPGTTDTVTNMPENETGLIPGSDNSYTVSSVIPSREGFEFIDWSVTWGAFEPTNNYSNALTTHKTAIAAAAGDANTARAYTITLETEVNIDTDLPAIKASDLFVEDLTVFDTIEDEFVLIGGKAEVIDSEGTVVSSNTVSVNGPTVSYNFGNIKNGHTARLILEITAQSDFIGSNGVFTNVGLSYWTYKHTDPEATAAENYSVTCPDKPQVNVPIVFSLNEKGKDNIKPWAETVALDGRNITIPVHNTAKNYDQTNGTFSYEWEILYTLNADLNDSGDWYNNYIYQSNKNDPRGDVRNGIWYPNPDRIQLQWPDIDFNYGFIVRIPASETVHISNGQPDVSEETLNNMGYINWKPEVTKEILNNLGYNWEHVLPPTGRYMAKLHVSFTPDGITGEETFADEVTAEIVAAKTKDGYLVFSLIPIHTSIDIEPLD